MRKTIYYLMAGFVFMACQPDNSFTIKGNFDKPFSGKVYLTCIKDRLTKIDSLTLESSLTFDFTGTIGQPDVYRIMTSPHTYDAFLVVEPESEYQVNLHGYDNNYIKAKHGGKEQMLINKYEQLILPYRNTGHNLEDSYTQAKKQDKNKLDSLQKLMTENFRARETATREFILLHPRTFTAAHLSGELLLFTYPELKAIYEKLDTATYAYDYGFQRFKKRYEEARDHWLQGQVAPAFTTHDLKGQKVSLSDFQGNYVLLDFWASWCAPCRKRAIEIKNIYNELQARGISVCGLNMDEDWRQWEIATQEDGIIWTNTGEVKPFKENAIAQTYKVTSLPTLFLIDPDGIIIMQNPEIKDLLQLPKR